MEKNDVSNEHDEEVPEEDETTKVVHQVTDVVSKTTEVPPTENSNGEEKNDDEVVPSTTPKPIDEQENVNDINIVVPSSGSPNRTNLPFKEVNESDKEESTTVVNGTENMNNKKRELDQEDEQIQPQENLVDSTERTNDQTKKIKTTESTDVPTFETNIAENNVTDNGHKL